MSQDSTKFNDFEEIEKNLARLESDLSAPEVIRDQKLFKETGRKHNELNRLVNTWRHLKKFKLI